jgi:hypothetical protein
MKVMKVARSAKACWLLRKAKFSVESEGSGLLLP